MTGQLRLLVAQGIFGDSQSGKKNRKFVGFSWVLVAISQIRKMLPKPMLGSSKPNKNPQIGILVYQL